MKVIAKAALDLEPGDLIVTIRQPETLADHFNDVDLELLQKLLESSPGFIERIQDMVLSYQPRIEIIGTVMGKPDYIEDKGKEFMVKAYTDAIAAPGLDDDRSTPRMFYIPSEGQVAYVLVDE